MEHLTLAGPTLLQVVWPVRCGQTTLPIIAATLRLGNTTTAGILQALDFFATPKILGGDGSFVMFLSVKHNNNLKRSLTVSQLMEQPTLERSTQLKVVGPVKCGLSTLHMKAITQKLENTTTAEVLTVAVSGATPQILKLDGTTAIFLTVCKTVGLLMEVPTLVKCTLLRLVGHVKSGPSKLPILMD